MSAATMGFDSQDRRRLLRFLVTWPSVRDQALVRLLLSTGLRASEAAALEPGDVALEDGMLTVTVRAGKEAPRQVSTTDPVTVRDLERWLRERGPAAGPLFKVRSGALVRVLVERVTAAAGMPQDRRGPAALRRTFLTTTAPEPAHP